MVGVRLHLVLYMGAWGMGSSTAWWPSVPHRSVESVAPAPFSYVVTTPGFTSNAALVGNNTASSSWTTSTSDLVCPEDTFVTRIYSTGGMIECTSLTITGSQGAYGLARGPVTTLGVPRFTTLNPGACPVGWLMAGITGRQGTGTPGFDQGSAVCRELTVTTVAP
jgi:hypothetical protein